MSDAGTAGGACNLEASDLMLYGRDAERSTITELLGQRPRRYRRRTGSARPARRGQVGAAE